MFKRLQQRFVSMLINDHLEIQRAAVQAEYWFGKCDAELRKNYEQQVVAQKARLNDQIQRVENQYQENMSTASKMIKRFYSEAGIAVADWNSSIWRRRFLSGDDYPKKVPNVVRIGMLAESNIQTEGSTIPALVPFLGQKHLLVISNQSTRAEAHQLVQSIILRLGTTFPPESVCFVLFDPIGIGTNLPFEGLPEKIRGKTILTEDYEIQHQMQVVTEHIRQTNRRLKVEQNVEIFNSTSEPPIPYYFLVLLDFPTRLSVDVLIRLKGILGAGRRVGVYTLIHLSEDTQLPAELPLDVLTANTFTIRLENTLATFPLQDDMFHFKPDRMPSGTLLEEILARIDQNLTAAMADRTAASSPQTKDNKMAPMKHVFVSYAHKASSIALPIRDELQKRGLSTWTDEHLQPGTQDWERAIEQAIETAGAFIVIMTPEAMNSEYIRAEIRSAELHGIAIFPILASGDPSTAVPAGLFSYQWADLCNWTNTPAKFDQLEVALRTQLKRLHVVLAYVQDDLQAATQVKNALKAERIQVWSEANLSVGHSSRELEIEAAIKTSGAVIVILSPEARDDRSVKSYIAFAQQNSIPIIPVLARGEEGTSIPLGLLSKNHLDITNAANVRTALRQMTDTVLKLI
jgi:hypothetical protein